MTSLCRWLFWLGVFAASLRAETVVVPGKNFTEPRTKIDLVAVPAGSFTMGNTDGEPDEQPLTKVTITHAFWMSKTEITQAQWRVLVPDMPAYFTVDFEQPVESLTWEQANEYCQLLTQMARSQMKLPEGYVFRLPTEAEWAYVVRASTSGQYGRKVKKMAWYDENSRQTTHNVAQKQANAWGIYDLFGNVWEWCADWYGPYQGGEARDPAGPKTGDMRVKRGGSWWEPVDFCTSSFRGRGIPGDGCFDTGFRVVLAPKLLE